MTWLWSTPLWLFLSCLGLLAGGLPRPLELWLGRKTGRLILTFRLFKSRIAEANIALGLPELSAPKRRALLEANFEHYGILLFEYMHFFSPLPGHFKRYSRRVSRLVNRGTWEQAAAKGKGVIIFSAHLGFWEMSAASAGLSGMEPTIVTSVLKPRWLHDQITACRAANAVTAAFHPGSLRGILKVLRLGGTVAFMNDQYAMPSMGLRVNFMGLNVDTLSIVGSLSRKMGAVVLPVRSVRGADGVTTATIEPELDLSACDDAQATQLVAGRVEEWVRGYPEQWLWIHRRFKHAKAFV